MLVKNQAVATQNGIYTVTDFGGGAGAWQLTRAGDFNQAAMPVSAGVSTQVTVSAGGTNDGSIWTLQTTVNDVDPLTDTVTFAQTGAVSTNVLTMGRIGDTATIRNMAGTAALPSYTFVEDLDVGFFRAGNNQIGIATQRTVRGTWSNGALTLAADVNLNMVTDPSSRFIGTKENVTQLTSNVTAVTADGMSGAITMFGTVAATSADAFVLNNSNLSASGQVMLTLGIAPTATDELVLAVTGIASGSCTIRVRNNNAAPSSVAPVLRFWVIN